MPVDGQHARVKQLFNEIVDLPDEAARRARLAELGAEPALGERALALAAAADADTRIGSSVAGMLASAGAGGESELQVGDTVGAWTLVGELGAGGMGKVFAAERSDGQYRQRAAIKLLAGWQGGDALARLARERQILASLSHPNIARLLDGGSTPLGRPYLVMDHVEGRPIDEWLEGRADAVPRIVELFMQVAEAVAYAHRQFVVHCDIKPSNLLVTPEGRAMLLDFGIAQLQGRQGDAPQNLAHTPRYASPEQKRGLPAGVASDVYGLGRLLGELMEAARAPRPREWRAIVARATEDDPERRYPSARALAQDLGRWQRHQPVVALPARWPYRGVKLLRRRWPWALVSGAALAASVAFTLRLVHERDRALAAEVQARFEARNARQVSDFVVALFEGGDPRQAGRPDLSATELLDRGRARIDEELKDQPALQASLKAVLGRAYENLGRSGLAIEMLRQAAAQEAAAGRPLRESEALGRMALVMAAGFSSSQAEAPARRALALLEQAGLAPDAPAMADAHNTLGTVLTQTRHFDESQTHLDLALAIRRARLGDQHFEVAVSTHNLAQLALFRGDPVRAEALYRRALALKAPLIAEKHVSTLDSLAGLATALVAQRRPDVAEPVLRRLLALRREVHGVNSAMHAERAGRHAA